MRLAIVRLIAIGMVLSLLIPATAVAASKRGIQSVGASVFDRDCESFSVNASMDWQRRRADAVTLALVSSANVVVDAETWSLDKPVASGSWATTLSYSTFNPETYTVRATLSLQGTVVSQLSTGTPLACATVR